MKIRLKFVSNSSSSSFFCEICGYTETGRDISAIDYDCVYCENGHLFCIEHMLNLDEYYKNEEKCENEEEYDKYSIPEKYCPICNFESYSPSEIMPYLEETRNIKRDEVFKIIKENNKRRKKLYDHEYINYIFEHCGLNETLLLDELKMKYSTYKEFINRPTITKG